MYVYIYIYNQCVYICIYVYINTYKQNGGPAIETKPFCLLDPEGESMTDESMDTTKSRC